MTPEEELAALRRLAELEKAKEGWTPSNIADEIGNTVGGGLIRGGIGVAGMPADLINLATQGGQAGLRKLGVLKGSNVIPRIPAGSQDIQEYLEQLTGTPMPAPKSKIGQNVAAAIAGGTGGATSKLNFLLGLLSGSAGDAVKQFTGNSWAAAGAAALPFGAKGVWQVLRPRVAEATAKKLVRNVTPEDWAKTRQLTKDFAPYGDMIPAQSLPPHSQAAGLATSLAREAEGAPIVDALVKQQRVPAGGLSQVQQMEQALQGKAASLYALGDKVKPTRAAKAALLRDVRGLPKELGVARGGELNTYLREGPINDLRNVLQDKSLTARELSVHADKLSGKTDFLDGAGPFFPAAAGKVAEVAKATHPAIAQADDIIAQKKALGEALGRVRIPATGGIAGADPGAVAPNTLLATAGQVSGHPLVTGAAIARMARTIVKGAPEEKLAAALSDPTFRKLEALVGAGRLPDTAREALLAAVQANLQMMKTQ